MAKGYKARLGIIAAACLGFAGWFFYDAAVKYPAQKELFELHEQYKNSGEPNWNDRWVQTLTERGHDPAYQVPERSDQDILTQYLMGGLVLPIGLVFGVAFLLSHAKWIAAGPEGLRTNSGQHAQWERIQSIDKSRWKSKGIAVVHYADESGAARRLTLDDWKYDREPITAMVAQVDAAVGVSPDEATAPDAAVSDA